MRELSLFTGAGGGLLGTLLLGWEPVGYVEWNEYCQRIIAQRIRDGILPNAPIFGDIRTFLSDGYAASYTGLVDVITGGPPCQPFSNAGKRAGANDPRNMWPETIECIRMVRPRLAFLENVPALIATGYFGTIIGDLAESGYDCRWRVLSAAELGAPHKRDRLWIVAHAQGERTRQLPVRPGRSQQTSTDANGMGQVVAHTNDRFGQRTQDSVRTGRNFAELGGENMGDTASEGLSNGRGSKTGECAAQPKPERPSGEISRAVGAGQSQPWPFGGTAQVASTQPYGYRGQWWATEPDVGRVAHGVASRVDRLRAIGNGQVPAVVRAAWHLLTEGLGT